MGINAKVRKYPKIKNVITAEAALERDIQNCMRCRFFHNSRQCIASECGKDAEKPQAVEENRDDECFGCPYRQSEGYCFPCMKKLLGKTEGRIT